MLNRIVKHLANWLVNQFTLRVCRLHTAFTYVILLELPGRGECGCLCFLGMETEGESTELLRGKSGSEPRSSNS